MHHRPILALIPALLLCAAPVLSHAGIEVGISVNLAPPALPVYVQPAIPAAGYMWTPGYWAWDEGGGYYWVPGTWVLPPVSGMLWTPGYWGWGGGVYAWHSGYWGAHVGFYGGVNYGYGYGGVGFQGGYWRGGAFFYNRAVVNTGRVALANVYRAPVNHMGPVSRVSFNGGAGGLNVRPTAQDRLALQDHHVAYTPAQHQQERMAAGDRSLRASVNGGRPAVMATRQAGAFPHAGAGGAEREGHEAGRPGQGAERPNQAGERPDQAGERSSQAQERPGQAAQRPAQEGAEHHQANQHRQNGQRPQRAAGQHPKAKAAQPHPGRDDEKHDH